jgi:Rieske Fe-S protein
MSEQELNRRDFIKVTTGIVGVIIGAVVGLPAVYYLIDPALKPGGKEAWLPIGRLEDMQVGTPYPFSFTRVQVNGWERTATSHAGYALRRSEDPTDLLILNSRCTHLACRQLEWTRPGLPVSGHDAKFSSDGEVLDGPPPRPLDRYDEFHLTEDGVLEIYYREA